MGNKHLITATVHPNEEKDNNYYQNYKLIQ